MPRGDRTGPAGMGPRTGRGMGFCADNEEPGYVKPGFGFRRKGRRGAGRGWVGDLGMGDSWRFRNYYPDAHGWGNAPVMPKDDEISWLESRTQALKESLAQMQKRLDTLKG